MKQSLISFIFASALGMGITLSTSAHAASHSDNRADNRPENRPENRIDDLTARMRWQGVREPISPETRPDLKPMLAEAFVQAQKLDSSCETRTLYQIELKVEQDDSVIGYEVLAICQELPDPAVALYFDIHQKFLRAVSISD